MHHDSKTLQKGEHFLKTTLLPRYVGLRAGKPLKIGVLDDIRALHPNVPKKVATAAMLIHCSSFDYLVSLKKSRVRVDLHGQDAGEVDPAHATVARRKLRALDKERNMGQAGAKTSPARLAPAPVSTPKSTSMSTLTKGSTTTPSQTMPVTLTRVEFVDRPGPSGKPLLVIRKRQATAG
jgi:sRNA-binding protein